MARVCVCEREREKGKNLNIYLHTDCQGLLVLGFLRKDTSNTSTAADDNGSTRLAFTDVLVLQLSQQRLFDFLQYCHKVALASTRRRDQSM
jgi:hypothetical protein